MQCYGPELEQRLRWYLKLTNKSWRVDETYVRVKGRWCYLYRAIDSAGATIDSLLSAWRDADAAKRLFRNALSYLLILNLASSTRISRRSTARPSENIKKDTTLRSRCPYGQKNSCGRTEVVILEKTAKSLVAPD